MEKLAEVEFSRRECCRAAALSPLTWDSNIPSVTRGLQAREKQPSLGFAAVGRNSRRKAWVSRAEAPPSWVGSQKRGGAGGGACGRGNPKPAPFPTPQFLAMATALLLVPAALASFILAFGTGVEFVRFTSLRPLLGGMPMSDGPGEREGSRISSGVGRWSPRKGSGGGACT